MRPSQSEFLREQGITLDATRALKDGTECIAQSVGQRRERIYL